MKKYSLIFASLFCVSGLFAQMDTIYTYTEQIACEVKEITPEAVKYSYPGESLTTSIYKNTVQKIAFKSGRVQVFAESKTYVAVNGVDDYESVSITKLEGETRGLFKVGDVSAKAKGTTTLSNQERVKKRAYRKLKLEASMRGANVIYLTDQNTQGNVQGSEYVPGVSTETTLSGVAYTNELPSVSGFEKAIGNKGRFMAVREYKLWSGASDVREWEITDEFVIYSITDEGGMIQIEGKLHGLKKVSNFRVVSYTDEYFMLFYEFRNSVYNVKVKI
jgi:hypothetical protein